MNDLISRQAAIDILYKFAGCIVDTPNGDYHRAYEASRYKLETLPSAQPERKKGRWIKVNGKTAINCSACYHCSWSLVFEHTVKRFNFCPNCGAEMKGANDEAD